MPELQNYSHLGTIPNGKLLTVSEMATRLSLTPATVRKWARTGRLAAVKCGDDWRFPEGEGTVMGRRSNTWGRGHYTASGVKLLVHPGNGKYVSTGTDDPELKPRKWCWSRS